MLKFHLCYPQTVSPQKPISLSPATSPVKWGMLTASALQDCSEDKGDGTGAMLGSELATSAQGRAVATASQNPVSGLQGNGLAAHTGGGAQERAAPAAQDIRWAPADIRCWQPARAGSKASEAQPEGRGRSSWEEAEGWARECTHPFLRQMRTLQS